ncbi:MAG: response regulator, partial [Kamptonema sp. SIO1D9]|nr:response regulator [Kamptonema sp. SIO1D9]
MNEQKNRQNKADILLIDDTLESLQLLVNLLSHHGYKIRPTSNTKLALSTAQKYMCYIGVNHHLCAIFNQPPEAFIGQKLGFLESSLDFADFIREF